MIEKSPVFELQPTLIGARLELRPLRPDDLELLCSVASDPLIWAVHPERDRHQREIFEKFFARALSSRGAFAVFDRSSGRMIGSSRYYDLDLEKSEVMIGYTFLARDYWAVRSIGK